MSVTDISRSVIRKVGEENLGRSVEKRHDKEKKKNKNKKKNLERKLVPILRCRLQKVFQEIGQQPNRTNPLVLSGTQN